MAALTTDIEIVGAVGSIDYDEQQIISVGWPGYFFSVKGTTGGTTNLEMEYPDGVFRAISTISGNGTTGQVFAPVGAKLRIATTGITTATTVIIVVKHLGSL